MRNLYLVRHGRVNFPGGVRRCIGRTDLPLDNIGRRQAEELADYFKDSQVTRVFCSPLSRTRETAHILAGQRMPVQVAEDLVELDMGEWENRPMNELNKNLESEPVTGERRKEGLKRMKYAIGKILAGTKGDVICVAHAGVNCCYLADLVGNPLETSRALAQPYGGYSRIEIDNYGNMLVAELGRKAKTAPDKAECEAILEHYHTPEHVRAHCRQVSSLAILMGESMKSAGCSVDLELIQGATYLHDVARIKPNHAMEGAEWLLREGYPQVADIIRRHHDLGIVQKYLYETMVVYLADKMVLGDSVVSLEERFEKSRRCCLEGDDAEEALRAHARRYREAKKVERLILRRS